MTFIPVDEAGKKVIDFGPAYVLSQSTYIVAPGSPIKSVTDANKAGIRICGVKDTATFRAAIAASANATHVTVAGQQEAIDGMKAGRVMLYRSAASRSRGSHRKSRVRAYSTMPFST